MRGFGVQLSKAEKDELFKLFDSDNSGAVTYDEFLHVSIALHCEYIWITELHYCTGN